MLPVYSTWIYFCGIPEELQVEREQAAAEGRAEGRAEGIISATVRMHMTDIGVLTGMLMDELLITPEQAHEYIKKFLKV